MSDIIRRLDREHPDDVHSGVPTQLIAGRGDYLRWVLHETAADLVHHSGAGRRAAEPRAGWRRWAWGH